MNADTVISIEELFAQLKTGTRLLGLDVGTKTIGMALSDVTRTVATPLDTIRRTKFGADVKILMEQIKEHDVAAIVIGLPINMDATEGPQAKLTRAFACELAKLSTRPVDLHDERLSSWAADRAFDEAQLTRKQRDARRDAVAAQIILQGYLDAME